MSFQIASHEFGWLGTIIAFYIAACIIAVLSIGGCYYLPSMLRELMNSLQLKLNLVPKLIASSIGLVVLGVVAIPHGVACKAVGDKCNTNLTRFNGDSDSDR